MSAPARELITVTLPGAALREGFWLYVWKVTTCNGEFVYYVGRTGDSSSPNAAPPYRRIGQHLGFVKASNALRSHLTDRGLLTEECLNFEFISFGPLYEKQSDFDSHRIPRDIVAALEKKLADSLKAAGYDVINTVPSKMKLDLNLWSEVKNAFMPHFPDLKLVID